MNTLVKLFVLACAILPVVYSHGVLVCPQPRNGQGQGTGTKLPRPPTTNTNQCTGTAGAITATYTAGSTIPVTWETTIWHTSAPGVRIAVSYSGSDSYNQNVLVNGADIGPEGFKTLNVTLPAGKTCNPCTLQWLWDSADDGGCYLECADIAIVSGSSTLPNCGAGNQQSSEGGNGNSAATLGVSLLVAVAAFLF